MRSELTFNGHDSCSAAQLIDVTKSRQMDRYLSLSPKIMVAMNAHLKKKSAKSFPYLAPNKIDNEIRSDNNS